LRGADSTGPSGWLREVDLADDGFPGPQVVLDRVAGLRAKATSQPGGHFFVSFPVKGLGIVGLTSGRRAGVRSRRRAKGQAGTPRRPMEAPGGASSRLWTERSGWGRAREPTTCWARRRAAQGWTTRKPTDRATEALLKDSIRSPEEFSAFGPTTAPRWPEVVNRHFSITPPT